MSENNLSSEQPSAAETTKKPYQKPSFRYEQVFVTSALSCTKTGTEGSCRLGTLSAS
jgi:hypothetical protein